MVALEKSDENRRWSAPASISDDHRHQRIVVWSALTLEADERPPPAYGAVDLGIRIDEVCEVTDNDVLRINTDVLKDIELLDG
jgi:hypothetical protein